MRETAEAEVEPINKRVVLIVALSVALAALLFFSLVLGIRGCAKSASKDVFDNPYAATTKVGYGVSYDGTVSRKIPQSVDDGGLELGYPEFGRSLGGEGDSQEYRAKLIYEANSLCTVNTWNAGGVGGYNRMDKDGNLYLNDTPVSVGANKGKLYKHSAADTMYRGKLSDDEPAVVKTVTMRARTYTRGYGVTGLYAPAGEVVTLEISKADMEATQGISVHIGQALYNGKANNIWTARSVNRMPVILNTFVINTATATLDPERDVYVAYIGSYLGGPIYVCNENVTFTVTISGGVRYSHFILGYTTPEDFAENAKSSAPYFDLEVWDRGVLHSGPKVRAENFTYDELYDAAVLWEKISLVSTHIGNGSNQGIVFLYDPFVAAGAAVAFPGQGSVNCPDGWMASSLNYKTFVTGGAWGNMHEYNHNFQGWGLPGGGEVTNNALNLVEYSLFTKISAARRMGNYGAEGTSGWNCYTNASWATQQVSGSRSNDLSIYATLLHAFGQDNFMEATKAGGVDGYFTKWADITHNDMTYYADLIRLPMSESVVETMAQNEYPAFVPVSCVYQTGRSYIYDGEKRFSSTMQPYSIKYGEDFTVDLTAYTVNAAGQYESGSLVAPRNVTLTVKSVSEPQYGKLTKQANEVYVYTPDKKHLRSGPIRVTVQINDGTVQAGGKTYKADDVDLVLEFEQSHEMNKFVLERTTYTFDGAKYATAKEAYEADYAGYTQKTEADNINSTQNSNTDIWLGATLPVGTTMEVRGKIYVDETAKYRLALRGRGNVALYYSLDNGKNYILACEYESSGTGEGFSANGGYNAKFPYVDLELTSGSWVHFKEVMLHPDKGWRAPYIGLGWGKFTPALGTVTGTDENGEPIIEGSTEETVSVGYATAYRDSYEFSHVFTSDYFYTRTYAYTYTTPVSAMGTVLELTGNHADYPFENVFDEDPNNYCSSVGLVSESSPWSVTVDLGNTVTATRFELQGNVMGAKNQAPSTFTLYAGMTQDGLEEVASFTNAGAPNGLSAFNFPEEKTFRYYRLVVTKTVEGRYLAIRSMRFAWRGTASQLSPDDKTVQCKGNWQNRQALSSFGHVNLGAKGATAEITFTGIRFGILSSDAFGSDFTVKIDGKKVASDIVNGTATDAFGTANAALPVYLSPVLADKKHTVVITCKKASDLDSVLLWKGA